MSCGMCSCDGVVVAAVGAALHASWMVCIVGAGCRVPACICTPGRVSSGVGMVHVRASGPSASLRIYVFERYILSAPRSKAVARLGGLCPGFGELRTPAGGGSGGLRAMLVLGEAIGDSGVGPAHPPHVLGDGGAVWGA